MLWWRGVVVGCGGGVWWRGVVEEFSEWGVLVGCGGGVWWWSVVKGWVERCIYIVEEFGE